MSKTKSGFTIVELLIVIVVIGILAAITIVAYNGIQQRARASSASAALTQASKKLAIAIADGSLSAYPADQTAFNALGINGGGVSYQYRLTSTGYCITATSGNVSYYINESGAPADGSCVGHTYGGNPLATNLIANPSFETNTAGWSVIAGSTISRVTGGSGIVAGNAGLEVVVTTSNQSGTSYNISGLAASSVYTFSVYITAISGDFANLSIRVGDGAGTRASIAFSPLLTAGQTVRKTLSWTSSTSSASTSIAVWRSGTATASATYRLDAAMVETGSTATGYSE